MSWTNPWIGNGWGETKCTSASRSRIIEKPGVFPKSVYFIAHASINEHENSNME